jgi:hypothetical protein
MNAACAPRARRPSWWIAVAHEHVAQVVEGVDAVQFNI